MSQFDVLEVLKKEKERWLPTEEIVELSDLNYKTVIRALNAMFKYNEVMRRRRKQKKTYAVYRVYLWKIK